MGLGDDAKHHAASTHRNKLTFKAGPISITTLGMDAKLGSMDLEQVKAEAMKYYKRSKKYGQKNQLLEKLIPMLTERPASDFITEGEGNEPAIDEDAIAAFRRGGETGELVRKANSLVIASQSKIEELESTAQYLERELERTTTTSAAQLKSLNDELERIKRDDSIERWKELIASLKLKRRVLPVKELKPSVDTQSYLMSQLFSSEYVSDSKDSREDFFQGQKEIELSIIEACIELLRNVFDELPTGVAKISKESMDVDVAPVLEMMFDSRNRLSYVMAERAFLSFLTEHVSEVTDILDMFNSRARQTNDNKRATEDLKISLSSYEKGLLQWKGSTRLDNYLFSYVRPIEIQRRVMLYGKNSSQLTAFNGFEEFPSFLLFCQPEDAAKIVLTTSKLVNNVCYAQLKGYSGPDPFSFYILASIKDDIRTWKLDPHALFVIRSFKHQYLLAAEKTFKQFYKDVFGHNEFKHKFEEQMEFKGIERWKQMLILYENMQIVGDEYLIGEIIRSVVRNQATHYPKEGIDILQGEKDLPDAQADFKRVRERWNRGLPPSDEEPEEYLNHCFDKYKDWRPEMSIQKYKNRWAAFLQQHKSTDAQRK